MPDCVSQDVIKTVQGDIEKACLKIVEASEPYPMPGRPIRHIVARCLIVLYTRGETRTLFDTLQALVKLTSEGKSHEREPQKMYVLGCTLCVES